MPKHHLLSRLRQRPSRPGSRTPAVTTLTTRTIATGAVAALALTLGACSADSDGAGSSSDDDKPVVLTTFTVLSDIGQNVAGDHLEVTSITRPGAEIHEYEPTPGDIRRASDADLILDNGLGLERWFAQFVDDLDVPHVVVSQDVDPIDITDDVDAGKPNPHAWMSPQNVQSYVDTMVDAFSELDPAHADDFAANGEAYRQKLQTVQDRLDDELDSLPEEQRALVTCEGAFSYLTRDAGLSEQFLWAVNAEGEVTPQQLASTVEYVRDHDVPAVFCESTVNDSAMKRVVQATDADFGGTLYVDSLSKPDGPVPTYLDLIEYDVDLIVDALSGGGTTDHQGHNRGGEE